MTTLKRAWPAYLLALAAVAMASLTVCLAHADQRERLTFDKGDNGLWMRRHWMHEGPSKDEIAALVVSLKARGIRRIYPFLGPMDSGGWPGWRSKSGLVRYVPERAGEFLREIHRIAPEIAVIPWTGGNLGSDVHLSDETQVKAFAEHARRLIALGADGVHLNIEPLPSGSQAYLDLLRAVKAAIGGRTLSVAAYPPPADAQSDRETHWDLPFMRRVCGIASEIAVMAYDTGLTSASEYETLVSTWTRQLAGALSAPSAGGCEWLMGVPAYDDDKDYHRPDVETIEHSLNGILAAFQRVEAPSNFRGVAIYASFTAGESKWTVYNRLWRGMGPASTPPPDPRNNME